VRKGVGSAGGCSGGHSGDAVESALQAIAIIAHADMDKMLLAVRRITFISS
jgi:hypothetical protein